MLFNCTLAGPLYALPSPPFYPFSLRLFSLSPLLSFTYVLFCAMELSQLLSLQPLPHSFPCHGGCAYLSFQIEDLMNQQPANSSFANNSSAISTVSPAATPAANPAAPAETPLARATPRKPPAKANARKAALPQHERQQKRRPLPPLHRRGSSLSPYRSGSRLRPLLPPHEPPLPAQR